MSYGRMHDRARETSFFETSRNIAETATHHPSSHFSSHLARPETTSRRCSNETFPRSLLIPNHINLSPLLGGDAISSFRISNLARRLVCTIRRSATRAELRRAVRLWAWRLRGVHRGSARGKAVRLFMIPRISGTPRRAIYTGLFRLEFLLCTSTLMSWDVLPTRRQRGWHSCVSLLFWRGESRLSFLFCLSTSRPFICSSTPHS